MQSTAWNEGLCPDTVTLNSLAKVGREVGSTFMEMTSHDTTVDLINALKVYQVKRLPKNARRNIFQPFLVFILQTVSPARGKDLKFALVSTTAVI